MPVLARELRLVFAAAGFASVLACFDDPQSPPAGQASTESGTGDESPAETGETTAGPREDLPAAETDTETDTSGDTDTCSIAGCPCEGVGDCTDGLECLAGQCLEPSCGDGFVSGTEQCDDSNLADGDGCDNDCTYTQILAVDAGTLVTCVLIEGGRVRCWGAGPKGQLGLGTYENVGDDELPNSVPDVNLPAPATQISVGEGEHVCAVLEDGTVRCWGSNDYGELGHANLQPTNEPGPAIQVGASVVEVAAGADHTCARTTANTVRCWGRAAYGMLGYSSGANIGDNEHPSFAGDVMVGGFAAKLALGGAHTCILSQIGTVRCWGRNDLGQLGYGTTMNIGDNEFPASVGDASVIPMGLGPFTKAVGINAGVVHTCAVFETGDSLCWGDALLGQLGTGNTAPLGDNELPSTSPPLQFPDKVASISAAGGHSCAVLDHGDAFCWGSNAVGQLGYGNLDFIGDDEPPDAGGPIDLGASVVQIDAGFFHTCALTATNEVRCWGNNDYGQLGLGHTDKIGDDELPIEEPPVAIF